MSLDGFDVLVSDTETISIYKNEIGFQIHSYYEGRDTTHDISRDQLVELYAKLELLLLHSR